MTWRASGLEGALVTKRKRAEQAWDGAAGQADRPADAHEQACRARSYPGRVVKIAAAPAGRDVLTACAKLALATALTHRET